MAIEALAVFDGMNPEQFCTALERGWNGNVHDGGGRLTEGELLEIRVQAAVAWSQRNNQDPPAHLDSVCGGNEEIATKYRTLLEAGTQFFPVAIRSQEGRVLSAAFVTKRPTESGGHAYGINTLVGSPDGAAEKSGVSLLALTYLAAQKDEGQGATFTLIPVNDALREMYERYGFVTSQDAPAGADGDTRYMYLDDPNKLLERSVLALNPEYPGLSATRDAIVKGGYMSAVS